VAGKNRVINRTAKAAIVYSGEAARGMTEDPDTTYFIPKEGSQIWVDNLAILAKAPHRELAEKFLNFVLEPEIGAKISNYTQFSTPNAAARSNIKPELLANPSIYPDEETMKKLEFLKDLGKETRIYDQLWTQVKAE
jgi:spermidine/putrescine transport system substrate-binding protein